MIRKALLLERDRNIHFPHFTVLKASAGSGKTHTLTKRFVQFILSEKIPGNSLRNILAITFSNNAAKEMKERTLSWLKAVCFSDNEKVDELLDIVSLDRETMARKAGRLIEEILENYSDFQIRTIDSFMTTIFKASAIDFGYNPEFDILMSNNSVMEYAFDLFLRNVRQGTKEANLFEEIIYIILEHKKKDASYPWDPSRPMLEEIKKIYKKLASLGKKPRIEDFSQEMSDLKGGMRETIEIIEDTLVSSGLARKSNSSYVTILPLVRDGRFADLIGKGVKNPPVNKLKKGQTSFQGSYDSILGMWEEFKMLVNQYTSCYAISCYTPYLKAYGEFRDTVENIKKRQGKVFIEDINWNLADYLDSEIVPDIYFRLGETIFHFLIDEFQDTSPIQWKNLFPLIENSLSQKGSAFIVGDTKQAIYGFRDADYTIMKTFEAVNPFPSAKHAIHELETNYRSLQKILEFNEKTFKEIIAANDDYKEAGRRSGLTDYVQKVREGRASHGYSEVIILEKEDEDPPERLRIQELVRELSERGYKYGDIAILTQRNEDVVRVTSWLNEKDIPFISYSSLDIRRRKVTGEIVSLLNFLDSPTDDLSFATFILGDIFAKTLAQHRPGIGRERLREFFFTHRDDPPLYKSFQREFGDLWDEYFSGLFRSAGYFPLYDLVAEIFSVFRLFELLEDEEATLVKILEVVKEFEGEGYNSLRDFLEFTGKVESGEAQWNMIVPKGIDAVKVMTIHKAKGLGFPVVIVPLYEEKKRGFDYIVQEEGDNVRLLKITKDTMGSDPAFEALYNEESMKERVNQLNRLYVGFTRPEEELYVIGVKGNNQGYPFDLLPVDSYPPSHKPERVLVAPDERPNDFTIHHYHRQTRFRVESEEMINIEERRRGEFFHRILFFVEYAGDGFEEELATVIKRVGQETGTDYPEEEIKKPILELVRQEEVAGYFAHRPGREVRREQEFSDAEGNLFRMDRLVLDPELVTVLDYKTGHDKEAEEKYMAQIRSYMKILAGFYPGKTIEGIIAYVDLKEFRRVS
jgi:ATP-dependent exoDNAse (exonuclease V) beta subunit